MEETSRAALAVPPPGFSLLFRSRFLAWNLHQNELLDILNYFKWVAHCELTLAPVFVTSWSQKASKNYNVIPQLEHSYPSYVLMGIFSSEEISQHFLPPPRTRSEVMVRQQPLAQLATCEAPAQSLGLHCYSLTGNLVFKQSQAGLTVESPSVEIFLVAGVPGLSQ